MALVIASESRRQTRFHFSGKVRHELFDDCGAPAPASGNRHSTFSVKDA
jgi:hypothetical protein